MLQLVFNDAEKKTLSFALKIFRYNHKVDSLSLAISGFQNGQSTHRIACEEADSWLAVVNAMTLNEVNMWDKAMNVKPPGHPSLLFLLHTVL